MIEVCQKRIGFYSGDQPSSYSDIHYWMKATKSELSPWEVETAKIICGEYVNAIHHFSNEKNKDEDPPFITDVFMVKKRELYNRKRMASMSKRQKTRAEINAEMDAEA